MSLPNDCSFAGRPLCTSSWTARKNTGAASTICCGRPGLPPSSGTLPIMTRQPRPAPIDGALVINKPSGRTSHDVVEAVRRLLGFRQVGHLGTLDPLATGVLVLLLGRATRFAQFYAGRRKRYVSTF